MSGQEQNDNKEGAIVADNGDGILTSGSVHPFRSSVLHQSNPMLPTRALAIQARRCDSSSDSTNSTLSSIGLDSISTSSAELSSASSPESWADCFKQATLDTKSNTLINPSVQLIKKAIQSIQDAQVPSSTMNPNYLYVRNLDANIVSQILGEELSFHGVRMTLDHRQHQMILKIMPYVQLEQIASFFALHITHEMEKMGLFMEQGDWIARGSGRVFGVSSIKEPDYSFYPDNVFDSKGGGMKYPTLTLEVGVSESYRQLQGDSQWWAANTSGRCSQVFLIKVRRRPVWRVDFEVWRRVPNPLSGPRTRARPETVFQPCQHAFLENGVVHGAPLILDFEMMMGRPPTGSRERDIVFGSANLTLIGTEVCR
ncbi:hypothetical protein N7457_000110 [Penicillium paradoxum]|uniref:uncharacterized protein n=1 Tax=Penicillium paradoxum TaxID=176176 RepID=UPI002548BF36|nr:uncharacterized protein N7457_000110 [Penicillium paradoxum]KAJ5793511.1 hypothetical protein N7457_000110 [Penicillium paradoxum]